MMSFSEGSTHAREFEDVPKPVAQKILADAVELAQPRSESAQQKVYRYRRVGAPDQMSQEVILPLDFEEVVGLSVTQQVRSDAKVS